MTPHHEPKIYHITHLSNLEHILAEGGLLCDSSLSGRDQSAKTIAFSHMKQRRMGLPVTCNPGTTVGDYVPFYFCPRSVMLYVIHCQNHQQLSYQGGQEPILHLEADLRRVVSWCEEDKASRLWAFSSSNAGARYASFYNRKRQLLEVDWEAIAARDFSNPDVKERKQAEFLIHGFFPWELIDRVGTYSNKMKSEVEKLIANVEHQPLVESIRDWYY
jgi:ssDNA thymidine ADP-ribosyltransferase, DarT